MRFLLLPAATDCNRGDQALLWQAVEMLHTADADCELAVPADPHDDPTDSGSCQTRQIGVRILPVLLRNPRRSGGKGKDQVIDVGWPLLKMKMRAILDFVQSLFVLLFARNRVICRWLMGKERYRTYEFLASCNAAVAKGGGYIYGYKGLRWAYYVWFCLFPLMLAHRLGLKTIVLPNSYGPFDTRWSRWLARRVLGPCDVLTAREPVSYRVLEKILPGKGRLYPDMAFALREADSEWGKRELARQGAVLGDKPVVGVTMRPWRFPSSDEPEKKYELYLQSFVHLLEHLVKKGYRPILFAHTMGPHAHEDDRLALREALRRCSMRDHLLLIDGDYNCRQLKAMYGLMRYMICTRFHSAIFAIALNVPCIAVSYQGYKASAIMAEIGLEDYCIDIAEVDGDTLIAKFERLVLCRHEVQEKMAKYFSQSSRRLAHLEKSVLRVVAPKGNAEAGNE